MTLEPKNGSKPPPALYAAALQHEHQRHAHRLAELKALEYRLRLLDAFAAPLKAQGITLYPEQVSEYAAGPEVWLSTASTDSTGRQLFTALSAVGFAVERRTDHGTSATVTLKHGRLRVRMFVDVDVLGPAAPPLSSSAAAATEGAAP
jgi:hypothetical protein